MSADPARHLRVVDTETGESKNLETYVQELQDQLEGAEKELRAWRTRYANLKRDKDAEARKHPLWPQGVKAFQYWQKECRHPRSGFDADRFWAVLPFLKDTDHYGEEMVRRAIDGAAYDPYTTRRKNGTVKRHDDWELIFRTSGKVEEFANRAPLKKEDP
jgi:hypothetical protein